MRVLFQGLLAGNRSGTGRYSVELVHNLARLEDGPEMVCLWPDGSTAPKADEKIQIIPCRPGFINRFYREQISPSKGAKKYGAALIHYPASVAGTSRFCPGVVTVHDLCYKVHPEWFPTSRVLYYNFFMDRGIRRAARVIADSQATAEDIRHFYKIPESRIDVVPLGGVVSFHPITVKDLNVLLAAYTLPETFFLFVGTLEPRKNLLRLLEAWARADTAVPDLVVAGRVGWKVDPEKLIGRSLDHQRVHFLDHVPQALLPALYSEAVAFVWPSLMEGFGLPLVEAMACGTPVITSYISAMKEVVGDAALTVAPHDIAALAEAMVALAEEDGLRYSLQQAGRKRAAAFSWQRTAALTWSAYQKAGV